MSTSLERSHERAPKHGNACMLCGSKCIPASWKLEHTVNYTRLIHVCPCAFRVTEGSTQMARLHHVVMLLVAFRLHCAGSVTGGINLYSGSDASASAALRAGNTIAQDAEELAMPSAVSDPSAVLESGRFSEGLSGRGRSLLQSCRTKKKGVKNKCAPPVQYECCPHWPAAAHT